MSKLIICWRRGCR